MDTLSKLKFDLNIAEDTIITCEAKLKKIIAIGNELDKEIAMLTIVKGNLTSNISILKSKNTVPLAESYKKAKADLKEAQNRYELTMSYKENNIKLQEDYKQSLRKAKENYLTIFNKINGPPANNILEIDFKGHKRG